MKKKLTKTGLFFALSFICTNIVSAQNYMITFSGSGQSNVVETVEVKNTTQQTSLTLNGSDTLHLDDVVGISPIVQENAGMKVYPNPTRHTSRVEFYNPEDGNVTVEIIDITGKILSTLSINLSRGLHAFEIYGLATGIYLLKAIAETTVHQQRLITYAQSFENPQINYLGSFDLTLATAQIKSVKNIVEMQYNDGERLIFKGISGDNSHTISLIPSESQNIDFDFIECLDGDGNNYGVVTIGEQVWLAENLKVGTMINGYQGMTDNGIIEKYCFINDEANCDFYGGLYQWDEMMNYTIIPGVKGICPAGWHVPSDAEWMQLINYVVAQGYPNNNINNAAGNALKSCRQLNSPLGGDCNTTVHPRWNSDGTHHGFDEFGFSAFPGGYRHIFGTFSSMGIGGYWWSSTEFSSTDARGRGTHYNYGNVEHSYGSKTQGFNVRCLRD